MTSRDYYKILNITRNASEEDIKAAFGKLARQYHPALNNDPQAKQKFSEVNDAYSVLSDAEMRSLYDQLGNKGLGNFRDFSTDTSNSGDWLDELFGSGFGFSTSKYVRRSPRRGRDFQMEVTLNFQEAVFGVEKEINIRREEHCARCSGSGGDPSSPPTKCETCTGKGEIRQLRQTFLGQIVQTAACQTCKGRGEIITLLCLRCHGSGLERRWIKKKVQIPAGVDTGTQIPLAGEGGLGSFGGPNGSIFLVLDVLPHSIFKRHKKNIILDLEITVAQAVLGAEVVIPTLNGNVKLNIPADTQPGKVFRIKGKGVPNARIKNRRGDQLVIVSLALPTTLTNEQRDLFDRLFDESLTTEQRRLFGRLAFESLSGDQTTDAPPPEAKKKPS